MRERIGEIKKCKIVTFLEEVGDFETQDNGGGREM